MIELLVAFLLKHFIVDFLLQRPYQYLNKGKYGHFGGVLHAILHGVGTYLILFTWFMFNPYISSVAEMYILLAFVDSFIHYHVDWAKVNICKKYNLAPTNSEVYWWILGLDQLLHYLTYVGIMYMIL